MGFLGDFCQQKKKRWNLLQIILCDKPTTGDKLAYLFSEKERPLA